MSAAFSLAIYVFAEDDLVRPGTYAVHPLHPQHLIRCLQLLRDAFRLRHPVDKTGKGLAGGIVGLGEQVCQPAVQQIGRIQAWTMLFQETFAQHAILSQLHGIFGGQEEIWVEAVAFAVIGDRVYSFCFLVSASVRR